MYFLLLKKFFAVCYVSGVKFIELTTKKYRYSDIQLILTDFFNLAVFLFKFFTACLYLWVFIHRFDIVFLALENDVWFAAVIGLPVLRVFVCLCTFKYVHNFLDFSVHFYCNIILIDMIMLMAKLAQWNPSFILERLAIRSWLVKWLLLLLSSRVGSNIYYVNVS